MSDNFIEKFDDLVIEQYYENKNTIRDFHRQITDGAQIRPAVRSCFFIASRQGYLHIKFKKPAR